MYLNVQIYFLEAIIHLILRSIALLEHARLVEVHTTRPQVSTYRDALFNGGSIALTLFRILGSILAAPRSSRGVMCANALVHRGPHFAA
jgi:hypothetical protein